MAHKSQHQPHHQQLHTTILIIIPEIAQLITEIISNMPLKRMETVMVITTIVIVITGNGVTDGNVHRNDTINFVCLFIY